MLARGPPSSARPRSPLPAVLQPALAAPLRHTQQLLLDLPQIREVGATRRRHHCRRRHRASPANHSPARRPSQSQPRTLRAHSPARPITVPSTVTTNHSPAHCVPSCRGQSKPQALFSRAPIRSRLLGRVREVRDQSQTLAGAAPPDWRLWRPRAGAVPPDWPVVFELAASSLMEKSVTS